MLYLKNNFSNIIDFFKLIINRNTLILMTYYILFFLVSSFGLYYGGQSYFNNHTIDTLIGSFSVYLFNIVMPLGGIYYLHYNLSTNKYLKNLKFVFKPLIKFKILLYILSLFLFILFSLSMYLKLNYEINDFISSFKDYISKDNTKNLNDFFVYLKETNMEEYNTFINYFYGYKLILSTIIVTLISLFLFSIFLFSIIDYFINDSKFFSSLKKSFNKSKENIIFILFLCFLFILIKEISDYIYSDNIPTLLIVVVLKSLNFSLIVYSFYNILNYNRVYILKENIVNNFDDNDPYNLNEEEKK